MSAPGLYLYDIEKLAGTLTSQFASVPYEKLAQDTEKIESAVRRLVILKERWDWLPGRVRDRLPPIDWPSVIGTWNREAGRHAGVDARKLCETIAQKLPEMEKQAGELLKDQSQL